MSPLGWVHFGLALGSLATGLAVVLMRKGTRWHRRAGWVYVAGMAGVNLSALMLYRLTGHFGPFHAAAIFSALTIVAGVVPARRRAPLPGWVGRHAYWMSGSYVGLAAAAAAETFTRVPGSPFWGMVVLATSLVMTLGAVTIGARVPPAVSRFEPRPRRRT